MRFQKSITKISFTILCAASTSVVFAQDFFISLSDGPYIGLQAGYDSYNFKQQVKQFNPPPGFTLLIDQNTLAANGWLGGILAGYGHYFKDFYYLGGEAMGNLNRQTIATANNKGDSSGEFNNTQIIVRGSAGLSILPGLKLSQSTLAYLRFGYNWANIQYKYVTQNSDFIQTYSFKSNIVGGFNFGLGFETGFYNNLSARLDVNHTFYGNFYQNIVEDNYIQTNISPSDNQATFALIYHLV